MKLPPTILSIIVALLLSGCITPYLDVQSHDDKVAALFNIDPGEFQFLDYCIFKENPYRGWDDAEPFKGIVGATETDLYLVYGNIHTASSNEIAKIPITEIEGVSNTPKEIQIKHGENLFVVVFYQSLSMKPNPKKSWDLYETMVAMDVPEFDATWSFSVIGDRVRSGWGNQGPGTMDDGGAWPASFERFPSDRAEPQPLDRR